MNQCMLVVEDEENIRESIAALLEIEGYAVCTARNGQEALRLLGDNASPISLIILDLMMPQMDGWSFRARQLKQPKLRDIPILVLSGAHQIEREIRALNPDAFLQKPVQIGELLAAIAPFLSPRPRYEA